MSRRCESPQGRVTQHGAMDAVSLRQAVAVLLWRVFVDPFISARGAALSAESPAGRAASLAALPAFYAYFFVFRPRRGEKLQPVVLG